MGCFVRHGSDRARRPRPRPRRHRPVSISRGRNGGGTRGPGRRLRRRRGRGRGRQGMSSDRGEKRRSRTESGTNELGSSAVGELPPAAGAMSPGRSVPEGICRAAEIAAVSGHLGPEIGSIRSSGAKDRRRRIKWSRQYALKAGWPCSVLLSLCLEARSHNVCERHVMAESTFSLRVGGSYVYIKM